MRSPLVRFSSTSLLMCMLLLAYYWLFVFIFFFFAESAAWKNLCRKEPNSHWQISNITAIWGCAPAPSGSLLSSYKRTRRPPSIISFENARSGFTFYFSVLLTVPIHSNSSSTAPSREPLAASRQPRAQVVKQIKIIIWKIMHIHTATGATQSPMHSCRCQTPDPSSPVLWARIQTKISSRKMSP